MVLGIFKFFTSKSKKKQGKLCTANSVVFDHCTLTFEEGALIFREDAEDKKFDVNDLRDVKHKKSNDSGKSFEILSYTFDSHAYKFESNDDLSELYNDLHPIVTKCAVVFECADVKYKVFNTATCTFDENEVNTVLLLIKDDERYYIKLEADDCVIHLESVSNDVQYYTENKTNTFVWSINKQNVWHTFCITFDINTDYLEFVSKYLCASHINNEGNEKYLEKMEIENYNDESDDLVWNDDEYCSVSEDRDLKHYEDDECKNEHLVVGDELAFVTRGSSVGVFKNTGDGIEFKENLSGIMNNEAKKIIAHDKCQSLIYLSKDNTKQLNKIDLNRCDVVESWDTGKSINDYFDANKLGDDNTLIGLSDYAVFRIDPRTKDKITESKEYKTKNEFMCGMATSKGHVAVAAKNGDLRLYDKIDKRAKSLIPGFGDEVKYVDVTSNGQHIICTCKNYLLLYSVNGDYKNQVGKDKPIPKKLTLRPEHLAYINEDILFTPAKFSTDVNEDSILTSTGKYVIKWNLQDVIAGKVFSYQMSRCSDLVVADNFEFGANDNIIVTMPDDVRSLKGSVLRRPNRQNFE